MGLKLDTLLTAEESDFIFVLLFGCIFLTISMAFYFCDSTYRNSFYFNGSDSSEDYDDNGFILKESPKIVYE